MSSVTSCVGGGLFICFTCLHCTVPYSAVTLITAPCNLACKASKQQQPTTACKAGHARKAASTHCIASTAILQSVAGAETCTVQVTVCRVWTPRDAHCTALFKSQRSGLRRLSQVSLIPAMPLLVPCRKRMSHIWCSNPLPLPHGDECSVFGRTRRACNNHTGRVLPANFITPDIHA
jgi:hypothetical protein